MSKYVPTKFRTHPLSFIPGGCIIIILLKSGESFIYDKIKYPKSYIEAALDKSSNIASVFLNNALVWDLKDQQPKPRKLIPIGDHRLAA